MIILKDPDAVLNYSMNWSKWLDDGDEIIASSWTVPDGITKINDSFANPTATIILSAGTDGTDYTITNHITTQNGLQDDRSITIRVQER